MWCVIAASIAHAQSPPTLSADIAAQSLTQALAAFAQQTGLQLIYVSAIAEAQQSNGAQAGLPLSEALTRLLDDTGLRFEFLNPRTVRIYAAPTVLPTAGAASRMAQPIAQRRASFRPSTLEEVVVTAMRREERADTVPISMMVWTQEAMEASGVKGMDEIGALTPGVEFDFDKIIGAAGYTSLIIRGVRDLHGTTTGVYIDDARVPAARGDTFLRSFPWAFDLDRVEVLRGPQDTLLGQGTLGGAVRFIMNQPNLTSFSGLARAEYSTTARGEGSYEAGAAAGGPVITDVLGFRISGWYRTDGGFVERVNRFTGGIIDSNGNRLSSKSVRVALTWAPTGSVRITPSLEYDSFSLRDSPVFSVRPSNPRAGELKNSLLTQQPSDDAFFLASIRLNADFATVVDLSAITSYFHRTITSGMDWSPDYPVSYADAATLVADLRQTMFSQEVRLTSADSDAALTWIAGGFYSSARKREASGVVPAAGHLENQQATAIDQTQLEGFGQIGFRITKHFTASAGLRAGRTSYDGVTEVQPIAHVGAAETAVTPHLDLTYQPGAGSLFYWTVAKGYRSGGVYPPLTTCLDQLAVFPPDTLWSYEIGAKHDLLDGRAHVESSVFHIRWDNEQADVVFAGPCGPTTPLRSSAASNGIELAAQALVTERVKATLALAYTDARYTQTLKMGDVVILHKGDAIGGPPNVPSPWNVTASIDYQLPTIRGVTTHIRAEDTFHSHNPGPFFTDHPASPRYAPGNRPDPSTNLLNVRASVRWPSFDLAIFVNNALDSQPTLGRRPDNPNVPVTNIVATTLRPRTVGLSGTWRFD